ncbi:monosaccharide ABC transporter substrate-binding protein, CUT2 family [Acidothermus cellulolyticus 11B]|jgi:ribose transport system substrate-binding protein|uniref:Monosaccharide ABC transporter substrate-binding protein, CUT2 family n=1 Tax=Acidothermus cellulolyticus (strain ATCC 43068 / DSM 8971 / 11B) TaxID=351607 RepID=A0LTR4_ACIC1|nr:sugar ABC transporter substrate-binding protein [Acidothermus cellulolyticus]ABK52824.1 monosaccharide ABC transporter substrate-binding protein, CUT2 family [Acidothermus cellulolyticus 11B]
MSSQPTRRRGTPTLLTAAMALAAVALAACSSGTSGTARTSTTPNASASSSSTAGTPASASAAGSANTGKTLQIAYLSFAVANSYDAPMLAAAQAVASGENAKVTVFDANNNPQTQFAQFQNAITAGKYDGILIQPILATNLVDLVKQAVAKGIKVVDIDQILGPDFHTYDPQVPGMSAAVVDRIPDIGRLLGEQVVAACQSVNANPCNVGYLYDIKASTLDGVIHDDFMKVVQGTPSIKVVAEGQDFFTPAGGLKAVQDMLQAHPDLTLIVGSDQGIEGAVQALAAAKKTGKVLLVGFGASAAGIQGVASGQWFSTVAQAPASTGRLGMQALIKAIRDGQDSGGINPTAGLPNNGIVTKATASEFTAEWPG